MAGNILDEIERKSQDILRSNEELASKLRANQQAIAKFNSDLEQVKGIKDFDPAVKKQLESIKSELIDKRNLITELIDDLKPLETDLSRREELVDSLKQRVDDQAKKIELMSKDMMNGKAQLQQVLDSNSSLKKQLVEKEGMISVLKDRLNEKVTALKKSDEHIIWLEQEVLSHQKNTLALSNRLGAVEKRVFSTDEQNQKLLYELMVQKERLKEAETQLEKADKLVESQNSEYSRTLDALKQEEEEKKSMILQKYVTKITAMNASMSVMKSQLEKHKALLEEKARKERELVVDFSEKMKSLLLSKDVVPDVSLSLPDVKEPEEPMFEFKFDDDNGEKAKKGEAIAGPDPIPKIDEITPMIDLALDHGDSPDTIVHSLRSSGYSKKDIDAAFEKLNLPVPN